MTTEADARAELEALGADLVITSQYQYNATVPAGHVISQHPGAGVLVAPDATVVLTVSLGPPGASIRFTGSNASGMQAAVASTPAAQSVVMTTHVFLNIENDPIYANDSPCTFRWGGALLVPAVQTWIGVAKYGALEQVVESLDIIANPVRLTLSGVDNSVLSSAMTNVYAGRTAAVYLALHDPRDLSLIDTPEEIWSGIMSVMRIKFGPNTGSIVVECEHRLRRRPLVQRYTDEDQKSRHAGDRFFQFLHQIPGYISKWGSKDVTYSTGRGSGGGRFQPGRNLL